MFNMKKYQTIKAQFTKLQHDSQTSYIQHENSPIKLEEDEAKEAKKVNKPSDWTDGGKNSRYHVRELEQKKWREKYI